MQREMPRDSAIAILMVVAIVDDDKPDRTYAIASMNELATSK